MKKLFVILFSLVAIVIAGAQPTLPFTASQLTNLVRTELPMQTNAMIQPTNVWNVIDAMVLSATWTPMNPRRYFPPVHEDFINGVVGGSYGWIGTPTGSGLGSSMPGDNDHIGIWEMRTAAATNSTYTLSSNFSTIGITTNMTLHFRAMVRLSPLSNATDDYWGFIGFGDAASAMNDVDRLGFEYSDNINGGNWRLSARKASVDSVSNSPAPAPVSNGWTALAFDATATQITGSIDGIAFTPVTTNIPLTANKMGVDHRIISTGRGAGTAVEALGIDYFDFWIDYGVNR